VKRLFSILFCLALLGCQQQESTQKPADLVPEDKMVQILSDVHVMEALIESNIPYPDSAVMTYNKQHKAILQKYGVSSGQFQKTYQYYGENLTEMDRLYEIILDTLTAREAKLVAQGGSTKPLPIDSVTVDESLQEPPRPIRNRLQRPKDILQQAPEAQ